MDNDMETAAQTEEIKDDFSNYDFSAEEAEYKQLQEAEQKEGSIRTSAQQIYKAYLSYRKATRERLPSMLPLLTSLQEDTEKAANEKRNYIIKEYASDSDYVFTDDDKHCGIRFSDDDLTLTFCSMSMGKYFEKIGDIPQSIEKTEDDSNITYTLFFEGYSISKEEIIIPKHPVPETEVDKFIEKSFNSNENAEEFSEKEGEME